eukprot:2863052-Pyramimonas_sp.AAC.1
MLIIVNKATGFADAPGAQCVITLDRTRCWHGRSGSRTTTPCGSDEARGYILRAGTSLVRQEGIYSGRGPIR